MPAIAFLPGRWYVMDRFASSVEKAYVAGPFISREEAETDRLERNIGDDCESWQAPDSEAGTPLELGLRSVLQVVRETGRSAHPRADQRVSDVVMSVAITLGLNPVELQAKVFG